MDNLHRSKEEAEAQHQMTLEKHEKERIEFEKRVRLAEEEQSKRLSQIQKEFIEKKQQVRQQRSKHPGLHNGDRPPLHGGHKRSSSHFDTTVHNPTQTADHKRNSSLPDVPDSQQSFDQLAKAPSSGGVSLEELKRQVAPNLLPARQVGSSSLNLRERSGSTSS